MSKYRISKYKKHTKKLYVIERFVPAKKGWFFNRKEKWEKCRIDECPFGGDIGVTLGSEFCTSFKSLTDATNILEEIKIKEAQIKFVEVIYE